MVKCPVSQILQCFRYIFVILNVLSKLNVFFICMIGCMLYLSVSYVIIVEVGQVYADVYFFGCQLIRTALYLQIWRQKNIKKTLKHLQTSQKYIQLQNRYKYIFKKVFAFLETMFVFDC